MLAGLQYMLKYHDVKTKGGVDFAEHLVAYYRAKESYFKDGSMLLQALKSWESRFSKDITEVSDITLRERLHKLLRREREKRGERGGGREVGRERKRERERERLVG